MHLIGLGHERIACIQGRSLLDAQQGAGKGATARRCGRTTWKKRPRFGNGFLGTERLSGNQTAAQRAVSPTAIFTLSNTILLGAVKAIRESGLRISQDISIISFDNNTYLDYLDPAVTRVSQPTEEIGILAVKILTESIADNKAGDAQILIPPKLIVCNSVSRLAFHKK